MKKLPLLLVTLFAAGYTSASSWYCPKDCACGNSTYKGSGPGYIVKRNYKNLSQIPNLSPLTDIPLPKFLLFSYSNIGQVSKADFPAGLYVTHLNLAGNRKMLVDDDAFVNLKELEYLNLESTKVIFNTTFTFLTGLSSLKVLLLSFTNTYSYSYPNADIYSSWFQGLGLISLVTLKMYNCGLRRLGKDAFLGVENITLLDLAGNRLDTFPEAISRLVELESLDMSHVLFKEIQENSFAQNSQLKSLKILYSRIERVLPGGFSGLEDSLELLDLRSSNVGVFPGPAIKGLKKLKVLKLDQNFITKIPTGSLSGDICLNDLSLGNNFIRFHDDIFKGQEKCLKHLYLRQMNLKEVPAKAVSILENLDHLFLDENKIESLTNNSLSGVKANLLVFNGNRICNITEGAFNGLRRPLYLSLDKTDMSDINFTLEYPPDTFAFLGLQGLTITCDCVLGRVLLVDDNSITGRCVRNGSEDLDLKSQNATDYLRGLCREVVKSGAELLIARAAHLVLVLTILPYYLL